MPVSVREWWLKRKRKENKGKGEDDDPKPLSKAPWKK